MQHGQDQPDRRAHEQRGDHRARRKAQVTRPQHPARHQRQVEEENNQFGQERDEGRADGPVAVQSLRLADQPPVQQRIDQRRAHRDKGPLLLLVDRDQDRRQDHVGVERHQAEAEDTQRQHRAVVFGQPADQGDDLPRQQHHAQADGQRGQHDQVEAAP